MTIQNEDITKTPAPQSGSGIDTETKELVQAMALAAAVALIIRTFLFEPFNIPSGSMLPNLLVGDYLFVSKYSYGYSKYSFPFGIANFEGRFFEKMPQRGDVAVFRQPKKPDIDYIKRIIGLPGDRIQVAEGILYINGEPVTRAPQDKIEFTEEDRPQIYTEYLETLPNGVQHRMIEISDIERFDNTITYEVPKGHYFAMGDNRDSSLDSRATEHVGFVPAENLVGRAEFIFFSFSSLAEECNYDGNFELIAETACKAVKLPFHIRYSRIFNAIR